MKARFLPMSLRECVDHMKRVVEIGLEGDAVGSPREFVFPHGRSTRDLACPQEIVTHHGFGSFTMRRFAVTEARRDLLLKLVGQDVEVPARLEVKEITH